MGVIERKDLHLYNNIKNYYEQIKVDQWKGNSRNHYNGGQFYGMKGSTRHLLKTLPLTGLYLLGQFRTTEPRLLTAARTAFAPIINTTTIGKVAKTGLQVLRGAQQLGLVDVGLTNSYADIPITRNPLLRAKSIFKSSPDWVHEVRNKYGLHYQDFKGKRKETTYVEGDPYNEFRDLIPIKIGDPDNPANTVQLRGIISGLTDNIAPTWNEMRYAGRPDAMMSYGGYVRDLTFNVRLAATSEHDIKPMYEKINALAKYVFPSVESGASTRFSGNLCKVTVGSWCRGELAAMIALTMTPLEDAMWETHDPDADYPSLTLTKGPLKLAKEAIERQVAKVKLKPYPKTARFREKITKDPYVMPRVVDLALGFKILHNHIKSYTDAPMGTSHVSNLFDTKTKSEQFKKNQEFKLKRAALMLAQGKPYRYA